MLADAGRRGAERGDPLLEAHGHVPTLVARADIRRVLTGSWVRNCNLAAMDIREVAVVGLGTMGAGIAEVLARGGFRVVAIEADAAALGRGLGILDASLSRAVGRGRLTAAARSEIRGRVRAAQSLRETATADLVIEAVPERLDIKRQIFAELDEVCSPAAILATNTSSLSVTTIAAGTRYPGRVVGMHFFNPAPVMRLVEVISTVLADDGVAETVADLAGRLGKTPVQVGDRAGFVANALLLPYLNQAVRLLDTRYASAADIDLAATAGIGLPMGPLALLDLIGLDTSLSILEVLSAEFGTDRYTPAPLLRRLAAAGRTGRKSGRGIYDYADPGGSEKSKDDDQAGNRRSTAPESVALIASEDDAEAAAELSAVLAASGLSVSRDPAQAAGLIVVVAALGQPVLPAALSTGRPADVIGLHLPAGLTAGALAEVVRTSLSSPRAVAAGAAVARRLGLTPVLTPDRPGFLLGTLLYPHLADAVTMVQDGYASAADVDAAMTLGCGYPRGPFALLDAAGPQTVLAGLRAMYAAYGAASLAPPPLLAEYAAAGLPPSAISPSAGG